MSKKKYIKNNPFEENEADTGDAGGATGSGIEFRDFITADSLKRDDQLSADDKYRLKKQHVDLTLNLIKKQKDKRTERQQVREGKLSVEAYRHSTMGAGMASQYKVNPILAKSAQFSGIDRQVTAIPTENIAETNNDKREELQLQYSLQHKPEYAYTQKFNPKPSPF